MDEWAGYCTRFLRNYNYITTSPNEASNGAIKGYGLSLKNGFVEIFFATRAYFKGRNTTLQEQFAVSKNKVRRDYGGKAWLGDCTITLTRWALDILADQHTIIIKFLPSKRKPSAAPTPCTGHLQQQFSLPCAHKMYNQLQNSEVKLVTAQDYNPFWYLAEPRDATDPYLSIHPARIAISKGRPRKQGGPFGNEPVLPPAPVTASGPSATPSATPVTVPTPSATPVTAPAPSAAPSTGRVTRSVATRSRGRGGGVSGRGSSAAPARARGRRVAPTAAVRARNTRARGPRGSRSLNSNISAQARRNYSQFELGPSLEELDHQDTTRDCIEVDGDD